MKNRIIIFIMSFLASCSVNKDEPKIDFTHDQKIFNQLQEKFRLPQNVYSYLDLKNKHIIEADAQYENFNFLKIKLNYKNSYNLIYSKNKSKLYVTKQLKLPFSDYFIYDDTVLEGLEMAMNDNYNDVLEGYEMIRKYFSFFYPDHKTHLVDYSALNTILNNDNNSNHGEYYNCHEGMVGVEFVFSSDSSFILVLNFKEIQQDIDYFNQKKYSLNCFFIRNDNVLYPR